MNVLRLSLSMALLAAIAILFNAPAAAQDSRQGASKPAAEGEIIIAADSPARTLSDTEARELQKRLTHAAEGFIQILNPAAAPVTISQAKVRGVKREEPAGGPEASSAARGRVINDDGMYASVRVLNASNRRVTGLGLQFTNTESKHRFYVYPKPFSLGGKSTDRIQIKFITVSGNPAHLSVEVVGVEFEDKSIWGAYPFPPPNMRSMRGSNEPRTDVDTWPRMLNSIRPSYTERARRNKVLGEAILRLEIGADGLVKQIKVINALPDGLTEEAIIAARQLRFDPARKNGQPISVWRPILVDFNLK